MTPSLPPLTPDSSLSYGRLRPTTSTGLPDPNPHPHRAIMNRTRWLLLMAATVVLVAVITSAITVAVVRSKRPTLVMPEGPTRAITMVCGQTEYPSLCLQSLGEFPGATAAEVKEELMPISVNLTMMRFQQAVSQWKMLGKWEMDPLGQSVYEVCAELLEDSVDLLNRTLAAVTRVNTAAMNNNTVESNTATTADVLTWLSAAMTNHETCRDELTTAGETTKLDMTGGLTNLSELVSNSLAIYAATNAEANSFYEEFDDDGSVSNRRLLSIPESNTGFPSWFPTRDRELLESTSSAQVHADVVVDPKNGGPGTVKTIKEAIAKAPLNSKRPFVIHIKAGRYEEKKLRIEKNQQNLWLIGDGVGQTVITGSVSANQDDVATMETASLGVNGNGFVAKDITFENVAGPQNKQAVALRVKADRVVVYRCDIKAYQDTLYVHSKRQFYRECNVYGTIDFIFGGAGAVFQHCTIYARKPLKGQKNTITAQARKDKWQYTGFSFLACQIKATSDLEPFKAANPTFLGRPWVDLARTVYMMSYMGDHIDPQGWLEWEGKSVDKIYYGEYMNYGPGADTSRRIKWPGVHRHMSARSANRFTVDRLILGSTWLPKTGIVYQAGLSSK